MTRAANRRLRMMATALRKLRFRRSDRRLSGVSPVRNLKNGPVDGQQQESQDRSVVDGTENVVDRGEKAQDALEVKDGKKRRG